jgi:hypothetical protein
MMDRADRWWRPLSAVLVDPVAAFRAAASRPAPGLTLAALAATTTVLGLATLPRQLMLLGRGLPFTGDALIDAQHEALRHMVTRLIVIDRLVPQPAVIVAAILVLLAAEPVLMLARDRRKAVLAVVVLGLAPLVLDRIGELAISYLLSPTSQATPGWAMTIPHRFVTGPVVFWRGAESAPQWLEILDARVNLVSLGCVALWSVGLRQLDGKKWESWHVLLPSACLVGAGLITWALTPLVIPVLIQ